MDKASETDSVSLRVDVSLELNGSENLRGVSKDRLVLAK